MRSGWDDEERRVGGADAQLGGAEGDEAERRALRRRGLLLLLEGDVCRGGGPG